MVCLLLSMVQSLNDNHPVLGTVYEIVESSGILENIIDYFRALPRNDEPRESRSPPPPKKNGTTRSPNSSNLAQYLIIFHIMYGLHSTVPYLPEDHNGK
jgi:hypothetical protein